MGNHRSKMSKSSSGPQLKQFADLEGQYQILNRIGDGAFGVIARALGPLPRL